LLLLLSLVQLSPAFSSLAGPFRPTPSFKGGAGGGDDGGVCDESA